MPHPIKVIGVKALAGTRLEVQFSNGAFGVYDIAPLLQRDGTMVKPLRDPAMFGRVFLQLGVPTWPNGFAIDAVKLHDDMKAAGALFPVEQSRTNAAE